MKQSSWLFVLRQAPYGHYHDLALLDMALAATSFDQKVALLFCDDGVYQLNPQQQSPSKDIKNHAQLLASLKEYDLTTFYACQTSREERGIAADSSILPVQWLSLPQITETLKQYSRVFT